MEKTIPGWLVPCILAKVIYNKVIVDIEFEGAKTTSKELEKYGIKTIAIKTDVTKPNEVDGMIEKILNYFGTIDIVFLKV